MGVVVSPFGNPALPTGPASGDLAGTYPAPTVAAAHLVGATGGTVTISDQITGDTADRFRVEAGGTVRWGGGAAGPDIDLYRAAPGLLQTDNNLSVLGAFTTAGPLSVTTVGKGLQVKEGSGGKQGTAVLVAGAVVVATTGVTATSRILLTSQVDGGTPGFLRITARTPGVSFTITSSNGADTSTVAYQVFEPA